MDPRALLKILEPFEVEPPPVEDGAPERLSGRTLITRWRHQREVDILLLDCLMITLLLVGPILSGEASTCHVFGMGQRVCRKRLLVHIAPTEGTLKRFRERSLQQRRSNMHDPRIVIDWLAATEHVKNIKQAWFTARALARIFAKHRRCDVSEVMGSTHRVHFELCGEPEFVWTLLHPWCGGNGGERYLIPPSASSFMWTALRSREVKKCLRVRSRSGTSACLG